MPIVLVKVEDINTRRPIERARVDVEGRAVETNSKGLALVPNLPGERDLSLCVQRDGYSEHRTQVKAGTEITVGLIPRVKML